MIGAAFGQSTPGFNLRITCDYPNTKLYNICIDNDTIVGLGTSQDSTGLVTGIVLVKFDTLGNLLNAKLLQDTLIGPNPVFMRWNSLLKTPDGGYIMNVIPFLFAYPVIVKTDRYFNVEFFKKYTEPGAYDFFQCGLKPLNDGYILHGVLKRDNGLADGFVRKIGFSGETVWFKIFGEYSTSESVVDVNVQNDSTFVVAMVNSINQNSGYSSLIILNNLGETIDEWNSEPEPDIGYLRDIVSTGEDGYLIYGLYVAQVLPPDNTKLVMSTFSKLDSDFNIENVQHYGKKVALASEIMFYNFEETIDGNYIAAGRAYTDAIDNGGWLMKFSPEGDSIWSRLDTSDVMPVHFLNEQKLGGVGVLSSGSIVAGGYVTNVLENNTSYIWLIKTTNDGCIDTLYCGLVSATVPEPPKARQQVSVYPNPASDMLHIIISEGATSPCTLSVLDMSGRVCGVNATVAEGAASIDVSALQVGLYMLCFKFANGEVLFKKLSVVK